MDDNRPAEGEAPTPEPTTGWRAALVPTVQPADADDGSEALDKSDDVAEAAEVAESDGDETGEDGSEEKAAVRQPAIPESPDGYDLPEIEGHKWSEADAPVLESFLTKAHATGLHQEAVNEMVSWYTAEAAKQTEAHGEAQRERDATDKDATVSALKTSLGEDGFKPAIQSFRRLLGDTSVFPKGLGEKIQGARFSDGSLLINNPAVAKFFIGAARTRYAKGGQREVEVNKKERLAEIDKMMKTDIDQYFAEGLDKECLELMKG